METGTAIMARIMDIITVVIHTGTILIIMDIRITITTITIIITTVTTMTVIHVEVPITIMNHAVITTRFTHITIRTIAGIAS